MRVDPLAGEDVLDEYRASPNELWVAGFSRSFWRRTSDPPSPVAVIGGLTATGATG
jgi:hypothetical protein